ncbi:MAG: uracil-DNA glycosylase [Bacteroidetes bacterium]|nr:uracil-DNA glycosylase [Bacteroidota bacterium]
MQEFEELKNAILHCTKCELAKTRQHVIFGEGNMKAHVLIIGEAPGRDEDIQGRPFVGLSGQLLDKILAACGFSRNQQLFINNIVKCRPPGNRTPSPAEASVCMPWLLKQIDLIDPKILILLGATALKYMAGSDYKITRDHGKWINVQNRPAIPVYHPAALLRNPSLKRDAWEDCKRIIDKYCEIVDPEHYSPHYKPRRNTQL